ncbi:hypothetical protein ACTFIY_008859 [Dictyostelium cf. discoideum]
MNITKEGYDTDCEYELDGEAVVVSKEKNIAFMNLNDEDGKIVHRFPLKNSWENCVQLKGFPRGYEVLIFTSSLDDCYGTDKVTSRIVIEADAIIIPKDYTTVLMKSHEDIVQQGIKTVFVIEYQFLSEEQVDIIGEIFSTYQYCASE